MTHLRSLPAATTEPLSEILQRDPRAYRFSELVGLSSARKARTAIGRGSAARILPDTYVATIHSASFAARADGALLWAGPTAALSGPAAMHVWGFLEAPPPVIDIVLPHPTHHETPPWLRVRRTRWEVPRSRVNGLTVVAPAYAVVLGFGRLPRRLRSDALHRAIRTQLVSATSLTETLKRVPRVPARRELRGSLAAAMLGAESFLEEHGLRKVFHLPEFARFLRQHRVTVDGEAFRLDMYDPATMTAVELDSDRHHSGDGPRKRDIRRDAALASVGIQTVRLGYGDLMDRPEWCRSVVRGVLIARSTS